MKTIYLVRHGESEGNVGAHYQDEFSPLTENGREQAHIVAKRAAKLTLDAVVASTMVRAQQTAEEIVKETGITIESSPLFVERRRPSVQLRNQKDSPESVAAEAGIIVSSGTPGKWYSDEENFDDLKTRAGEALAFLENHPCDSILVVTHGTFLRNLIARMLFGDRLTGPECIAVLEHFVASNTGITVLTYDSARRTPWWLLTWNDHAHLG